ncbi:MAG: hypothetical protein ABEJ65_02925, partial [bacterium]
TPGESSLGLQYEIPLEQLDLQVGDVMTYRVRSTDANNVSGPGVSESDLHFLNVEPFDVYREWAGVLKSQADSAARKRMRRFTFKIRNIMNSEKAIMNRTVSRLSKRSSDTRFRNVSEDQADIRTAADSVIRAFDEYLKQDNVQFPEDKYLALRDASKKMKQAAKQIKKRNRNRAIQSQRIAVNKLNKVLQFMRVKYFKSDQQISGSTSSQVTRDFDAPEDTGPVRKQNKSDASGSKSEKPKMTDEVKQMLDRADRLLKQYKNQKKVKKSLEKMGEATKQRLLDLLKRLGELSKRERRELARMVKQMDLVNSQKTFQKALDKMARKGQSKKTTKDLWNDRRPQANDHMDTAGLSAEQKQAVRNGLGSLKPCRVNGTCSGGAGRKLSRLKKRLKKLTGRGKGRGKGRGRGSGPTGAGGEQQEKLAKFLKRHGNIGNMTKRQRKKLAELAEQAGLVDNADSTVKRMQKAGDDKLREASRQARKGNTDKAQKTLEESELSRTQAGKLAETLYRLESTRRLNKAMQRITDTQQNKMESLLAQGNEASDTLIEKAGDVAEQAGLADDSDSLSDALKTLKNSGTLRDVMDALARGNTGRAKRLMQQSGVPSTQARQALRVLSGIAGASSANPRERYIRRLRWRANRLTDRPRKFKGTGSVVKQLTGLKQDLRKLHRVLLDEQSGDKHELPSSPEENVPEELAELVRNYFRQLNE